jgi:preprotein translocase subunit SecB
MKNSPLQLEDYLLSELQFRILLDLKEIPPSEQDFDALTLQVSAKTEKRGRDPRKWRCDLTVRSNPQAKGNFPYAFSIQYTGFFAVIDEFPLEYVEQMVKTNAPAILYSSARETLMHLTGRGRLTAILLPSITFLELPKGEKLSPPKAKPTKRIARKK